MADPEEGLEVEFLDEPWVLHPPSAPPSPPARPPPFFPPCIPDPPLRVRPGLGSVAEPGRGNAQGTAARAAGDSPRGNLGRAQASGAARGLSRGAP